MTESPSGASVAATCAAARTPAEYLSAARQVSACRELMDDATPIGMLSSATLDVIRPYLVVESVKQGLPMVPYFGPFGQFEQPLVDPGSAFWSERPEVLVMVMRPEDLDPDAVIRFHRSAGAAFGSVVDQLLERLAVCHQAFRERSDGPVLIANLALPPGLPLGVFDANEPNSLTHAFQQANRTLAEGVAQWSGSVVWDYAGLVRHAGDAAWTDPRLWAVARIPIGAAHQPRLAEHLARTVAGTLQKPAKCLVLDLDNTLWGGAIGDAGLEGIQLGDDHPGSAFKALQRTALSLMDRGVLLAVVSKNDHDTAEEVFRRHPEMLIRWDDLAAARINWDAKSDNLRAVAEELNIGLDALVLLDDNPVERAEVRANAPEVGVIDLPDDPLAFGAALMDSGFFDQVGVSAEDLQRSAMYGRERQRRALAAAHDSVDDFLRSLEMVASVGRAGPETLGRIGQLIGKTNQFNLTTQRHPPAVLEQMSRDPNTIVAWLRLADRFGDQGLVAVGIVRCQAPQAIIDTFLMSCRVMNRGVESAFLAFLAAEAAAQGCPRLIGEFRPTPKNHIVSQFYPELGFVEIAAEDTIRRFERDIATAPVPWPEHITPQAPSGASSSS